MEKWRFHTPGWVDEDLSPEVLDAWHSEQSATAEYFIGTMLNDLALDHNAPFGPDDIPYANPITTAVPPDVGPPVSVGWDGFPEQVTGENALNEADETGNDDWDNTLRFEDGSIPLGVRHRQDEYLEWFSKSIDGVLQSVTFVCEGYDYYEFLFNHGGKGGRDRVVELYRKATGDSTIQAKDLEAPQDVYGNGPQGFGLQWKKGAYFPRNQINQKRGIVHLSHKANSLGAEVGLAVTSSVPLVDAAGKPISGRNAKKLMCASGGGDPNRSSDPQIAAGAYQQTTAPIPQRFTLTDPVGLYIRDFRYVALSIDGHPKPAAKQLFKVDRGKGPRDEADPRDSRILRLHVEVAPELGYRLGDMEVAGSKITHGGQLARLITMHLLVNFWPAGRSYPAKTAKRRCCISDGKLEIVSGTANCLPGCDPFPELLTSAALTTPANYRGLTRQ